MTLNQTVPTTGVGGDGAVVEGVRRATALVTAGADWRQVDGDSQEDGLDTATGTRRDAATASRAARSRAPAPSCRTS